MRELKSRQIGTCLGPDTITDKSQGFVFIPSGGVTSDPRRGLGPPLEPLRDLSLS